MKKIITCLCLIVLTVSFVSCSGISCSNGTLIKKSKSTNFSKEEIDSAISCVTNYYGDSKILKKIYYDEERFNNEINEYGEQENYKENKGNIIILHGSTWTGKNNPTLPSNILLTNISWILIRNDENSDWIIYSSGQC